MPPRKLITVKGYDLAHRVKMTAKTARHPIARVKAHKDLKRRRAIGSLIREFPGITTETQLRNKLKAFLILENNNLKHNTPDQFRKRINNIIKTKMVSPRLSLHKIVYG